ncbi:MAG: glycosyltransferase family 4 protein, partial [Woeseia sp.]|nr:glycosyltransferase family 4 protein [Woeseia sp.]NNE61965.1 glycosyltransferase family 4 protein [Woeseia sp.]
LCKLFRVPLAVREFGNALDLDYEEMSGFFKWAIKTVFRADRVLLETKSLMKYFEKTLPEAKCEWYSNSREISTATAATAATGRGARRFVFMGHVKADKGLNEILAASEALPFESCKIDVYGSLLDGFTEKNFENSPRVKYHGELTSEKVMPTLRQYDVVLLPTHLREGYPGTIIEAYAAGLPVIATRCGAIDEIVEDGVTGLLINPRDADALAEAMCKLSKDPEFFRRLSEGALLRAHDFSSTVWTQRFVEICNDIITERKSPELSGA